MNYPFINVCCRLQSTILQKKEAVMPKNNKKTTFVQMVNIRNSDGMFGVYKCCQQYNMKTIITILFVIFELSANGQFNEFYNNNLIDSLLVDTIVDDYWYKEKIKNLITQIKKDKGQTEKMFPYTAYDSVVAYRINEKYKETEKSIYIERVLVKGEINKELNLNNGFKLSENHISKLLTLINNPLNFDWAECGTPIPYGLIIFYRKNKPVSFIQLACSYQQIDCYPVNLRTKLGGLRDNKIGYIVELMKDIKIE